MTMNLKTLLCVAGIAVLAGCSQGSMTEFHAEAGAEVDEGGFGNPTMNNFMAHAAQMCVGRAKGYIVPDPVVMLDPSSPGTGHRYLRGNVRCMGPLNGKYAEVIFQEYVDSATYFQQITPADAGAGEGDG